MVPLVVVSAIFVAAYAYVFARLAAPFGSSALHAAALVVSVTGPALHISAFASQASRRRGRVTDVFAFVSYVLMGLFAYLFVLSVARDVVLLVARAFVDDIGPAFVVGNAAVVVLSLAATGAGFVFARAVPHVRDVTVPIADLPDALVGFTLAQLTDVHVGATIKRGFIERVVERTNAIGADVIAITGDLIDGSVEDLLHDVAPLADLRARHGVFYVTGNHEYYSGALPWVRHVASLGIEPLLNAHRVLAHDGETIVVAGVPDETAAMFVPDHACSPARALEGAPNAPTVLLAHQPRSVRHVKGERVDLMLAGHTHGGQFWPWTLFVPLQQPYVQGLVRHASSWVYTSRGTGYWGPPLRLFAPSEITRIRLVRA